MIFVYLISLALDKDNLNYPLVVVMLHKNTTNTFSNTVWQIMIGKIIKICSHLKSEPLPANGRWKNSTHKHSFEIGFWSLAIYRKAISQNWTFGLESNRSQTPTQSLTSFWWPQNKLNLTTITFLSLFNWLVFYS